MPQKPETDGISRRHVLAALGTASTASLAGCGSTTDTELGEPSDEEVPPPTVDAGDEWQTTTPDSEPVVVHKGSVSFVDYKAVGHIKQFENIRLRERIKEETFGEIDRPFMVGFGGRIDLFPGAASWGTGLKEEEIDEAIISNLKDSMRQFGVENVSEAGTMEREDTKAETWHVVTGGFPVEAVQIEGVEIPYSDKSQLEFGGDNMRITGLVGRWKEEGSIIAAGGVYPSEEYSESEEIVMSDAISLQIDIDLGLNPEMLQSELFDFTEAVSL